MGRGEMDLTSSNNCADCNEFAFWDYRGEMPENPHQSGQLPLGNLELSGGPVLGLAGSQRRDQLRGIPGRI